MLEDNDKQKSPQRRFLLILGGVVFAAIFVFGLMVMFDENIFANLAKTQRILFGSAIIIYAVLRVSRIFKRRSDEV
jgi:hypothetical protein